MEQNKDERLVFDGLAKASGFVRLSWGGAWHCDTCRKLIFMKDISGPTS
jgi:ribosome-binding factor A